MSKRSWFYAFACAIFCSTAIALQPTVRAGSISLSGTAKPTTSAVTPTIASASAVTPSTNRGSTVSKFSQGTVVPVSTNQSNNVSSSVLAELQRQIEELKSAQLALSDKQNTLEDSQSQTSSVIDSVATQVQTISSANSGLTSAVSDLQSDNATLQASLNSIQQQANSLGDSLNANIDSRLQYRGLLDNSNNLAFATKNDLNPETLAIRIATNPTATATLSEKITPKEEDIQQIIKEDLIDRQILESDGSLNVEKKGQVQVTEETVTAALNNSSTFKNLVSEAAVEKGFVTNTALNDKGFVTADSETITNLASKTEVENLKTKVEGDVNTEGSLLNTIRENESIRQALKGDKGDKGEQGDSTSLEDVVDALKRDAEFINTTKAQDATSTWYEYCAKGNNLSSVVQQLYPSVTRCEDFTSDQFNSMMNGPKGQCLSWAVSPDNLQKDSGIGLRLTKLFGSSLIDNLRSYRVGTKVMLSGQSVPVTFVDACADKYDEIIKPDDPKTIELAYCEAQAENYASGVTNLIIIKKLYPSVISCDQFTFEMYTAITSGAKAYCISLATNPDDLNANSGIGLRLEQTFGAGIVDTLKLSKLETPVNIGGTRDAKNFVEACVENYDAIMAGKDAKSVEQVYCEAQAENYPEGTTNLTIIKKLYSGVNNCSDFTADMYAAITSGAKAYCKSLAQKPEDLTADSGIGAKLVKVFGTGIISNLQINKLDATVADGTRGSKLFVEACEENYNEIMAGKDAKSVEQVYCEAQAENYPEGTINLDLIKKLYSGVNTCDDFTSEMYTAITSGAKAYCKSLAQKPEDLTADSGIGAKLEEVFGEGIVAVLKRDKLDAEASIVTKTSEPSRGEIKRTLSFVEACEQKYDEIMSGKSATPVWELYCEAQADNYPAGTTNLTLIKKLFSTAGIDSCKDFTKEQYAIMTAGAKEYCLNLNATFNSGVSVDDGVGLKLAKLYVEKNSNRSGTVSLDQAKSALQTLQGKTAIARLDEKVFGDQSLFDACVDNYNQIMSGEDGKDAETAWHAYCEMVDTSINANNTTKNLDRIIKPLYGNNKTCDNFTSDEYNAITGGAKAYCLSLATDPSKLTDSNAMTKKLKKVFGNDIVSKLTQYGAGADVTSTRTLNRDGTASQDKFVNECAARYDEIMGILPVETEFCESEDRLEKIIKPLYGDSMTCDTFTNAQYQAILGGAKAYCLSLVDDAKNNKLDANKGIGLKLEKILGTGIINQVKSGGAATPVTITTTGTRSTTQDTNFVLACEEKYNEIVAGDDALGFTYRNRVATYNDLPATCEQGDGYSVDDADQIEAWQGLLYICNCHTVNGVESCAFPQQGSGVKFQGAKGEDGKSAEQAYCEANYSTVSALYSRIDNINKCSTFTVAEYKAMMEGAKAYCLLLAQDFADNKLVATSGIGKKLNEKLKVGTSNDGIFSISNKTLANILNPETKFNGSDDTFLAACEKNYNEIMAGDKGEDAETVWHAYCEEVDIKINPNNTATNLERIIKPLYGNSKTCDNFTSDEYNAIMGGAKAYCLSLATDPSKLSDSDSSITKKLKKTFGNDIVTKLSATGAGTTVVSTRNRSEVKFVDECERRYDEIMAGDKGEDAKSAEQTYCETNFATVSALYSSINDISKCSEFTVAEYKAMMEGAKAYCLLLAQDFAGNKLVSTSGIGKRMNEKLKIGTSTTNGIFSLADKSLSNVLTTKYNGDTDDFLSACEKTYNEIMAGEKGESGEDAITAWCKEHTTGLATSTAKMSAAKMVRAFDKLGGTTTAAAKINTTTGRFNSLEDCINAVKADPSLMGGESAADEDFNEDNKGKTITLSSETKTTLENKKTKFQKVVTDDNIGTKMQTSLATNTGLKNSLKAAGVMMSEEANTNMFSAQDVLDLLSGGVQVQKDGTLGINTSSQKGAAVISKLTSAGVSSAAINNAKATTNIATSVATVAAQAATATVSSEDLSDATKCNKIDYMFWNNNTSQCEKCPDDSIFKGGEVTNAALSYKRCACEAPSQQLKWVSNKNAFECTEAAEESECLNQPETYWRTTSGSEGVCEMCPGETEFNPESLENTALDRCTCKETGYSFNTSTGECEKLGANACPENTYYSLSTQTCTECPDDTEYQSGKGCVCKEEGMFNTVAGTCMKECPDESDYNPETRMCVCHDENMTINQNEWKCEASE